MAAHRHMDEVAAHYEKTIPAHVARHYANKRVAFIAARLARGLIADVGCGTGLLAVALKQRGYAVVGMDESFGMLRECLSKSGVACAMADAARLPAASGCVDAAICVATLHHVVGKNEIRETLREMLRIVKPGGWALVWDHNPLNPYWPFFMRRLPQDQEETRLVPLRELVARLQEAGALRIEARRLGLVPDFAPPALLKLFQMIEWLIERAPVLNIFCAHNVVVAFKRD